METDCYQRISLTPRAYVVKLFLYFSLLSVVHALIVTLRLLDFRQINVAALYHCLKAVSGKFGKQSGKNQESLTLTVSVSEQTVIDWQRSYSHFTTSN